MFLIQLIGTVEKFVQSDKIVIKNPQFNKDEFQLFDYAVFAR